MAVNSTYNELMRGFEAMVKSGNPLALEAKRRAEVETDPAVQQQEYLPYLISVASEAQAAGEKSGALQAIQRFIQRVISAIKAWTVDKLGVPLKLSPDDVVALAERMVQRVAKDKSQPANSLKQASLRPVSETADSIFKIDAAEQQRIGKEIDRLAKSLQSYPEPVRMKMPKVLLALDGLRDGLSIQDLPLELDRFTLRKMTGHVDGKQDISHQLTLDQVKQLPSELTDPIAVLHSDSGQGLTVITSLQDLAGNPVVSAVHLNKRKGKYVINEMATAFGKENFKNWISKRLDKVIYLNSEKNKGSNATLPHLLGQSKTGHVGVVGNRTSEQNILKPEDIVKKMGDKPLFSRRAPGAFAQGIKAATVQNIKDQTSYKFKDWLGVGLQVLGRRQLVDIYHKLLPQLTQYNNLAAQMDADKNDAGAKADELARRWAKVKDHESLANLMHDATLSGFDPALPYSQGDRFKYQQLRRAYDALTPEAKALYADVRDAYTDHQKAVLYAIKQRIMRSELSNQKKAELLKNMDSNFFHKRKGVYFPLARFGKYVVVVRNNAGVVESVSRAETMGEAQAMRKELLDRFPQNQGFAISEVSKDKAFVASRDMVGRGFMTELYAELDKQNIPASQKAELEDTLGQLYLSSLPDLSWAKHGIHRKFLSCLYGSEPQCP